MILLYVDFTTDGTSNSHTVLIAAIIAVLLLLVMLTIMTIVIITLIRSAKRKKIIRKFGNLCMTCKCFTQNVFLVMCIAASKKERTFNPEPDDHADPGKPKQNRYTLV